VIGVWVPLHHFGSGPLGRDLAGTSKYQFAYKIGLIWAIRFRSGGSRCKIPLRPGDLSKEALGFVIINPPSTKVIKSIPIGPVFRSLEPGLLEFCVCSPQPLGNSKLIKKIGFSIKIIAETRIIHRKFILAHF
jgi:hypothetical protein